jgi:hypothetical protein
MRMERPRRKFGQGKPKMGRILRRLTGEKI